ncbi:hypothetical protein EVAR_77560_1 [Eumeta japonica]|uniref:Uncharacterized protein n=1 Tax=Eumeta variegata TaxID=151549 RepID=A0A4C1T6K6_EUMVA|nr:hypothetical protein EVAR_77560_1 [Eumeta japonica]
MAQNRNAGEKEEGSGKLNLRFRSFAGNSEQQSFVHRVASFHSLSIRIATFDREALGWLRADRGPTVADASGAATTSAGSFKCHAQYGTSGWRFNLETHRTNGRGQELNRLNSDSKANVDHSPQPTATFKLKQTASY